MNISEIERYYYFKGPSNPIYSTLDKEWRSVMKCTGKIFLAAEIQEYPNKRQQYLEKLAAKEENNSTNKTGKQKT